MTRDDEQEPEAALGQGEREVRAAKAFLFLCAFVPLSILVVVLLVFFQPDHQVFVSRWPNGYRKTVREYVAGPGNERILHGRHRAWHEDGTRAEEGRYQDGIQAGEWRYWRPGGGLDLERSGFYADGVRVRGLESSP